jgi:hypothetical protein
MLHQGQISRGAYSLKLLRAGIHSWRSVFTDIALPSVLHDSARDSARLAAAVTCGWALAFLLRSRSQRRLAVAFGGLVFCVGFAWRTRSISDRLARCVWKEIDRVRDEHWLQMNPIDYA